MCIEMLATFNTSCSKLAICFMEYIYSEWTILLIVSFMQIHLNAPA